MQTQLRSSLTVLVAMFLGACASKQLEPLTVSSAAQSGYASEYPANLARLRGQFTQYELQVQQALGEFPTYPAQLDKPHWADVEVAVTLADEEGKSQSFVDAYADRQEVEGFFEQEGKTIKQKVGGAAQFAAKEKNCDVELYGPTAHALDKSVEKQLQDRAEAKSEAVQYIEDNSDRLLEKNVEKLKVQVGKIAEVSYLTHVAVRQTSRDLQVLLAEASTVKSTLQDTVERAKAVQSDANRSKADVARAAERQKAAEAALGNLDSEVKQAEHVQTTVEERAKKLDAAYEQALDALKDAIEAQAKAEVK
ncbi:MAG: hypothetical protein SFV15_21865 [Polyangiaceae bacterium]|nr:hypothetical protein [Polyangiaceae bacterium]